MMMKNDLNNVNLQNHIKKKYFSLNVLDVNRNIFKAYKVSCKSVLMSLIILPDILSKSLQSVTPSSTQLS